MQTAIFIALFLTLTPLLAYAITNDIRKAVTRRRFREMMAYGRADVKAAISAFKNFGVAAEKAAPAFQNFGHALSKFGRSIDEGFKR